MRNQKGRAGLALGGVLGVAVSSAACGEAGAPVDAGGVETSASELGKHARIARGRDIWLTSTCGGETFFSLLLPQPPFRLELSLVDVLLTPRAQRFTI